MSSSSHLSNSRSSSSFPTSLPVLGPSTDLKARDLAIYKFTNDRSKPPVLTLSMRTRGGVQGCGLTGVFFAFNKQHATNQIKSDKRYDDCDIRSYVDDNTLEAPNNLLFALKQSFGIEMRKVGLGEKEKKTQYYSPEPDVLKLSLPSTEHSKIQVDGFVFLGTGIGSDRFVFRHIESRIRNRLKPYLSSLADFGTLYPGQAIRLLTSTANS